MNSDSQKQDQMRRKHIFVIDSDHTILELARVLLEEEEGFHVTTTNFMPETFDQIAALQPDLLIIDLTIGEQSGWDLLEQLEAKVITRKIPVIVVSTNQQLLNHAKVNRQRYGGNFFMAMPLDVFELLDAIHSLLRLR